MSGKIFLIRSFCFSWILCFLFSSLAYANGCPNSTPQESQVWRDFEKVVQTEYFDERIRGNVVGLPRAEAEITPDLVNSAMVGHALGRLALAVQGQPDRRTAFDCVQLAIEQRIATGNLWDATDRARIFRIMMQVGYGMHDKELGLYLKRGLPKEPLYGVLDGKMKNPSDGTGFGVGGGNVSQGKTTPMITKKDPAAVGGGFPLGNSSRGGKDSSGGSSEGHCSNWMTMSFSDSTGKLHPADTEKACTITGKSGDFITRINPTTKACSVCSQEDWTPASSTSEQERENSTTAGGTEGGGEGTSGGGDTSGKFKCHLYSGYLFSRDPDAEFNVLKANKPDARGYIEFLYTVAPPSKRFNNIEKARKDAERILKEGTRGKQYGFAFRGGPNAFCNFIESQCDLKKSSVKVAEKACMWSK